MRIWLSVIAVSLAVLGAVGTAAAQPCEPWCMDLSDDPAATATGATGTVAALAPALLAGAALLVWRVRPGSTR